MKRVFALVLALVMAFSLVACGSSGSSASTPGAGSSAASGSTGSGDGTYNWNLACVTAADHPMTKACLDFADKVKTATNGRINITVYYGGQLGSDPDSCTQVIDGTLQMAFPSVGNIGSFTDLVYAYQLPFMITNWDQYLALSKTDEATNLLDAISSKLGVKALGTWNSGFRHLLAVNGPITSLADCSGKKFRVGENSMFIDMFSALGASPTVISYGEIYTSLQNKVIDALEMDISAIYMEKHYEVAKYLTLTGHYTWPGLCIVNEDAWNSLSADDQAIFEKAAEETLDDNISYIQQVETDTTQKLKDAGVQITEMTDSMRNEFVNAEKGVIEKYTQNDVVKAYYDKALSLQK